MSGHYGDRVALSPRVPDLGSLELLLAVSRTGSLGAAGRELGLTQQAVSARVRTVEKLVGVPVLHRTARGSTLTDAGALMVHWAVPVLAAAEELDSAIGALRGERDAHLDVAASFTVAEYLLPGWLVRLRARAPGVAVGLVVRNSDDVVRRVLAGQSRLGFVEGPEVPPGLSAATVAVDELVLVVPPGHPWTRRRGPVPAAEVAGTPLVTREPGSGTRATLEDALRAAAPDTPLAAPALELAVTTAIRQAVLAGAGPAALSDLAVSDDVAAGRLVRVPIAGPVLRRELRAVWASGPVPAGPARDLLAVATGADRSADQSPDRPPDAGRARKVRR
ncbi:LysR family transcriptional regulator [Pseudonocardia sp. KRD-184]|uniref:LysR family transcriptional regulator n=1 Tax=Pseudonocardia oceani TaxID=2792013 RepID=A0ABS6U3E1_9PSEU|nr:LysR family transcriptional regulator [Pseudonocardia oceani]MBW0098775.1 LysR family transcriptional regulator [Pseudonocardia oceani]MBW0111331.1 LysR family transcriptional regulator [Pseudonocardia oceani]MBW0124765.1 LysR family transcriptional regulator [Pseudonocardia oceani]MBW0126750.1 LysR family transcriptional regulator [Pseudonocardia oceani]